MSETSPIPEKNINQSEARRRLDELVPVSQLAHEYSRVERGTEHKDGAPETDGDHVVHLGMLALAYALKYRPDLDPGRVALYVLLHDVDEAKVGDTPTIGASAEALAAKDAREAEGRQQIEAQLKDFPELIALMHSLHNLEQPEDEFGKAFDKLVPGYMHAETDGRTVRKYGIANREELLSAVAATDEKMQRYTADHPDIMQMRLAGHERVAEQAFSDQPADPDVA